MGEPWALDVKDVSNLSVIGAEMVGPGAAQIFAPRDYNFTLLDMNFHLLSQVIENIRSNPTLMAPKGIGHQQKFQHSIERIKTTLDLEEGASQVQFVVEANFENLGRLSSPSATLSTNTPVMYIMEIAGKVKNRGRNYRNPFL